MTVTETAEQEREKLNTGTKPMDERNSFDQAALARWMQANVADYAGPLEVRQFKGGQSNPTYQLVTPARKYVLRKKPAGKLLPSAHAVDREYRVISSLGATGFPVAHAYGLCTDDSVIGAMFYVMDMVEGRILWDQTLPQYEPAERRAIYQAQIDTLADLHNTDYQAAGLGDYGKPGNYMGRQVDRWSRQYQASEPDHNPAMERLMAWLPATVPPQERTSVVHGDYRLDNMILHATEPRVAAVLDWELSTLGEPLADITYFLMYWINGPLAELPDLTAHGIPTLDEAVAQYCARTNRPGIDHLDWYFAYNTFRLACIYQGILGRARAGTANSPEAANWGPKVNALAEVSWRCAQRAGAPA